MISPRDFSAAGELSHDPVATLWPSYALSTHVVDALGQTMRAMDELAMRPEVTPSTLETLRSTALLVRTVLSLDGSAHAALLAQAHEVARALAIVARASWMTEALLWRPADARDVAFAHLTLTSLGRPDVTFHQTLQRALAATTSQSGERLPYDRVRHAWLTLLAEPSRDALDGMTDRTAVASPVDLCAATRQDLRALSEGLMWVTDLGRRTPRLARATAVILDEVDSAVAIALDAEDVLLAAQLLMAWPMLQTPWPPSASFAFAWIVAELATRRPSVDGASALGTLSALALAGPWRPLTQWPPDASRAPLWHMLRGRLDRAPTPSWIVQLDATPWERQRGTTTLLLDAALRRAVNAQDRNGIRELVVAVEANGARGTALYQQAAALLGRLEYEPPTFLR
jgi:hypothetical protein